MRGTIFGLLLAVAQVYGLAQDSTRVPADTASSAGQVASQQQQSEEFPEFQDYSEPYTLFAGVQLGIVGAGIATENSERRKSNPDFWILPTYGAVVTAPISKGSRIAGRLDLSVWQTGTRTRPYAFYDGKQNWEGYFVERYTYFSVVPYVNLSGILIGVGFDFPMKGEWWNPNYDVDPYITDRSTMKIGMDFRIGGSITAWESDLGILNVELLGYYMFSGVYQDGKYPYGLGAINDRGDVPINQSELQNQTIKNLTPAGGHLGISYQFKLGL